MRKIIAHISPVYQCADFAQFVNIKSHKLRGNGELVVNGKPQFSPISPFGEGNVDKSDENELANMAIYLCSGSSGVEHFLPTSNVYCATLIVTVFPSIR